MNYVVVTDKDMIYINNVKEEFQFTITSSKGNFRSYKLFVSKQSFVEMITEEDDKEFVYKTATEQIDLKVSGSGLKISVKTNFGTSEFKCDSNDQFVRKGVEETMESFFDYLADGISFYHNA